MPSETSRPRADQNPRGGRHDALGLPAVAPAQASGEGRGPRSEAGFTHKGDTFTWIYNATRICFARWHRNRKTGACSMHPGEIHTLKIGATVWIWVVRLGRGRWWPGTVEGIRTVDYKPRVVVRFGCRQATDRENSPPVMAGITTT